MAGEVEMDKCDFCKEIKPVERTYLRPSKYSILSLDLSKGEHLKLYNEGRYFIIIRTCSDCGTPKI
jgi:hypothetical protein